ncbi:hypothetical protein [Methylobacterium sp. NEAU K]|uniref:hypothetical protein n=1 Tax=Methylobacterium sp. NEAU K TaxID=3064946 RepID=UPI0027359854|nr:hypothetical protein [Methylobacterium sp. NEAU K]MDP4005992.1 hypothetical protein [Methylobacterium sp. NEAU K]
MMGNGDGTHAPNARLAEVQRLATALAARVRYAQLVRRPIYEDQISALVRAARLMDEEKVPWPPMVEEVLMELAKSIEATPAAEAGAPEPGGAAVSPATAPPAESPSG